MKKISIFVEGQTERIFVERLLDEYLTIGKFKRVSYKLVGDRALLMTRWVDPEDKPLFVLIYDVGCDEKVLSAIIERGTKLLNEEGYTFLLGLRDLYPNHRADKERIIKKIEDLLHKCNLDDRVTIILAVMEVEAWFLADYSVFQKINATLTTDYIKANLGIDLISIDSESFDRPTSVINEIYNLVGAKYRKKETDSYQISHRIDYPFLCIDESLERKISSFHFLLKHLDMIFELPS